VWLSLNSLVGHVAPQQCVTGIWRAERSARFSAHVPHSAAIVRLLNDTSDYRIGRSADGELRVEHNSVSRFHAGLRRSTDG
jgi:hypothetical protein